MSKALLLLTKATDPDTTTTTAPARSAQKASTMPQIKPALLALCVALSALQHSAVADKVTSKFQVQIPQTLRRDEGYDHREALFGLPPYGASIEAKVYYAGSTLCNPNADYTRGGYPERPIGAGGEMEPMTSPYILMVDRGDCTFVKKARNAQKTGATALLIADDSCLCSAGSSCIPDDLEDTCEPKEPIMADDGSGSDITIPSFLLFKQEADPIKKTLTANAMVRAKMSWSLPQTGDTVNYELWTTPTDTSSRPLQRNFRKIAKALGEHASFSPHNYVYDGAAAGCVGYDGENQCSNLCTNNGRYCLSDPDDNLQTGLSGADVVKESLRRACIWQEYGKDGVGVEWWTYIDEFLFRCDDSHFTSEECVKDAMEHSGVEKYKIDSCMKDAGGLDTDDVNHIFESELSAKESTGVVILPSLYVNKSPLRGRLSVPEVFEAICAAFANGSQPAVCKSCQKCPEVEQCIDDGKCPESIRGETTNAVSTPVFIATVAGLTVCFGCIGLIQWQRSQRQMRAQVRGIMAEYMPVDENKLAETIGFEEDGVDDDRGLD